MSLLGAGKVAAEPCTHGLEWNAMETVTLRRLNLNDPTFAVDLAATDAVLMGAYDMPSRASRVQRFLRTDHGGWVVAEVEGTTVGAGGYVGYPSGGFGWIGLIGTDSRWRGRGVATMVTQWCIDRLRELGCVSALDASIMGAPVYRRMGFVDHGVTRLLVHSPLSTTSACEPLSDSDLADIISYDAVRFGADRSSLLNQLVEEFPDRIIIVRRAGNGRLRGYAIGQDDTVGPVIADDPEALDEMLTIMRSLHWKDDPRILVPSESMWTGYLLQSGWNEKRLLAHQRLPDLTLPDARRLMAGQVSFGEG